MEIISYLFIDSKEASLDACEIWLKLRLLSDMATFQTLLTWIGHNETRYHNLNAFLHALLYIFSGICLVLGWTTVNVFKIIVIYFFINLTVTRGNPLQIAPNHARPRKKFAVTRVTMRVVTDWSCGNALHYGLSMFV